MIEPSRPAAEPTTAQLLKSVNELTAIVAVLADRFARKRVSDAVLGLVVAAVVLLGSFYYFIELPDRRADTRDQIRNLACYAVRLRPPGYSPTSDALRARYRCPPFDPSAAGASSSPSVVPSSRRPSTGDASTPTAAGGGAQRPSAGPSSRAATGAGPSAARTVAAGTAPRRPGSAPRPSAVASTGGRDATPAPTALIQLPGLGLCVGGVIAVGSCRPN